MHIIVSRGAGRHDEAVSIYVIVRHLMEDVIKTTTKTDSAYTKAKVASLFFFSNYSI